MGYRVHFALLLVLVMVACRDSASRRLAVKHPPRANATLPTVPPDPILPAAFTIGTLPQSSGASPQANTK